MACDSPRTRLRAGTSWSSALGADQASPGGHPAEGRLKARCPCLPRVRSRHLVPGDVDPVAQARGVDVACLRQVLAGRGAGGEYTGSAGKPLCQQFVQWIHLAEAVFVTAERLGHSLL